MIMMLVIGILTIIGCEPIKPHFLGMGFNAQTLKCGKYEVVFNFNSQCNPYISLWSQSEFGDWQYTSASGYEIVVFFWLLRTTRNRKQRNKDPPQQRIQSHSSICARTAGGKGYLSSELNLISSINTSTYHPYINIDINIDIDIDIRYRY